MSRKSDEILNTLAAEIIERSSDGFLVINDKNEVAYANPALKKMHGFDLEETITQEKTLEILAPDPLDRKQHMEKWQQTIAMKNPPAIESQMATLNGEKRWYRIQPSHLSNGFILVNVTDVTDRKLAEFRYRAIFEKAPDGIVLRDAETGSIIDFNDKACELLGYTREEYARLSITDIKDSSTKDEIKQQISKILKDGSDYFEATLRCKNGKTRRAYISATAMEFSERKIIQIISHDISAHSLTKDTLNESETNLQKILEQAPISMAIISMTGVIEYINKKAINTFGYLPEDIPVMDKWWIKAYPDAKYRKEVIATWNALTEKAIREQREIEAHEYRVTCKNGSTKIVLIFGVPVANKVFVMFEDITDRKHAEAALQESEEMFRNLAEQSPNMIFIFKHLKNRVVYANRHCEVLTGYSLSEIYSGKFSYINLIAPEFHQRMQKAFNRHVAGQESPIREYVLITKQGKRIAIVLTTRLINFDGEAAIMGVMTDVTEMKKVQKNMTESSALLKEQKKALEHKNTALKEILAQIETEKLHFKQQVSVNIEKLLLPTLRKLRTKTSSTDSRYIDVLESNTRDLVSTFGLKLSSAPASLSPREMEIANMIKTGISSKEIAELLHLSIRTVDTHRNRIRKKLGINTSSINLSSHLQNLN